MDENQKFELANRMNTFVFAIQREQYKLPIMQDIEVRMIDLYRQLWHVEPAKYKYNLGRSLEVYCGHEHVSLLDRALIREELFSIDSTSPARLENLVTAINGHARSLPKNQRNATHKRAVSIVRNAYARNESIFLGVFIETLSQFAAELESQNEMSAACATSSEALDIQRRWQIKSPRAHTRGFVSLIATHSRLLHIAGRHEEAQASALEGVNVAQEVYRSPSN